MKTLILNSGSSSQKSALFDVRPDDSAEPVAPLWEGKLDWEGGKQTLTIRNSEGKKLRAEAQVRPEHRQVSLENMLQNVWSGTTAVLSKTSEIDAVGHRIVHGGPHLTEPVVIDPAVRQAIADVSAIAPLHNKPALQGIDLIAKLLPRTTQIAVFDTGFHRTLPVQAAAYPGPYEWYQRGIRRFGFHGINHEYCAHRAARMLRRDISTLKLVTCHLGNGCSLAAIDGGTSVDTTMGFTPLEGLMMGTRSGSVDPGTLLHVMRTDRVLPDELDDILNHRSGLLGISGVSSDMRDILEAIQKRNERAQLAFDMFVHRLQAGIGAMAASLGGLDALVFTAGIGENSPEVRKAACAKFDFLGIQIDQTKNSSTKPDSDISQPVARGRTLVIRAQEDWAIAQECARLCSASG